MFSYAFTLNSELWWNYQDVGVNPSLATTGRWEFIFNNMCFNNEKAYLGFQQSPHLMCVQWFCSQTVIPCGHWKTKNKVQHFTPLVELRLQKAFCDLKNGNESQKCLNLDSSLLLFGFVSVDWCCFLPRITWKNFSHLLWRLWGQRKWQGGWFGCRTQRSMGNYWPGYITLMAEENRSTFCNN